MIINVLVNITYGGRKVDTEKLFTYKWGMELLQTIPFKSKIEEIFNL